MHFGYLSFISLGSNFGDRKYYLSKAVDYIAENPEIIVDCASDMYQTPAEGAIGNSFYNQCIAIYTTLDPFCLLNHLQNIETRLERKRSYLNSIRTIDIDLILYEDRNINTETLVLPHPRAFARPFVVMPLRELCHYRGYKLLKDYLSRSCLSNDMNMDWIIKLGIIKGVLHVQ